MAYQYACVVDRNGYYKDFVLIVDDVVQYYTLLEGERLANTPVPDGFVKPWWSGDEWKEAATKEEIQPHAPCLRLRN